MDQDAFRPLGFSTPTSILSLQTSEVLVKFPGVAIAGPECAASPQDILCHAALHNQPEGLATAKTPTICTLGLRALGLEAAGASLTP